MMRRLREPTPTVSLTFSSGGDALYRGQWDGWIVAYDKTGRQLGRLDWQSWGQPGADKPSFLIKLIEVLPEYRRRGVATALYRELFRQEGITERDLAPATQSPEGTAFRRGARLGPPQFVLTHDGLEVMRGSENQIWTWLHRNHSYSVDWALKYEGYAIIPASPRALEVRDFAWAATHESNLGGLSRAELERMDTDVLDRAAFGFVQGDTVKVPVEALHVRYTGDLENAEDEVPTAAVARRVLRGAPPISVSLRDGLLHIEDGHHRFVSARLLGRHTISAIIQDIHDNPIDAILEHRPQPLVVVVDED